MSWRQRTSIYIHQFESDASYHGWTCFDGIASKEHLRITSYGLRDLVEAVDWKRAEYELANSGRDWRAEEEANA